MLLTSDMPNATEFEVRDVTGRKLTGVMSYDTETTETEIYLCDRFGLVIFPYSNNEWQPVTVKTFLPGSYAVEKKTGKKITPEPL